MMGSPDRMADKALSNIEGLDDVLGGGFMRKRLYLIEGSPGTGKTTLALQFLLAGVANGEAGLYITLSETAEELKAGAASHGWSLDALTVFELVPPDSLLDEDQQQTLLYSADLELGETTKRIMEEVERVKPSRLVLDSLSEIRLLAQGSLRFRRQVLAMKHVFARIGITVLMLDDLVVERQERTLHSIAHGVLVLGELVPEYGTERRRLRMTKCRGTTFRGGFHDFAIVTGGLRVFPRLVAAEQQQPGSVGEAGATGILELDNMLGGGLPCGTSTMIMGPSGTGKSLLAMSIAMAAVKRGEKAAIYVFDEEIGLLTSRMSNLGFDMAGGLESGRLILQPVDAAELSPGEFAHKVRSHVQTDGVRTIVIDSLNGYQAAMPQERFLILHMHELLTFMNRLGVISVLTMAQHGLIGDISVPANLTYLSDTVLLLRFFEAAGRLRRAISTIKKRTGAHEETIREFRITQSGFVLGDPLVDFHGVLAGGPIYRGKRALLEIGDEQ